MPRRPGPVTATRFLPMHSGPHLPGAWHLSLPSRTGQVFRTVELVRPGLFFAGSPWTVAAPLPVMERAVPLGIAEAGWPAQARSRRGLFTTAPAHRAPSPANRGAAISESRGAMARTEPGPVLPAAGRPAAGLVAPAALRPRRIPRAGRPLDRVAAPSALGGWTFARTGHPVSLPMSSGWSLPISEPAGTAEFGALPPDFRPACQPLVQSRLDVPAALSCAAPMGLPECTARLTAGLDRVAARAPAIDAAAPASSAPRDCNVALAREAGAAPPDLCAITGARPLTAHLWRVQPGLEPPRALEVRGGATHALSRRPQPELPGGGGRFTLGGRISGMITKFPAPEPHRQPPVAGAAPTTAATLVAPVLPAVVALSAWPHLDHGEARHPADMSLAVPAPPDWMAFGARPWPGGTVPGPLLDPRPASAAPPHVSAADGTAGPLEEARPAAAASEDNVAAPSLAWTGFTALELPDPAAQCYPPPAPWRTWRDITLLAPASPAWGGFALSLAAPVPIATRAPAPCRAEVCPLSCRPAVSFEQPAWRQNRRGPVLGSRQGRAPRLGSAHALLQRPLAARPGRGESHETAGWTGASASLPALDFRPVEATMDLAGELRPVIPALPFTPVWLDFQVECGRHTLPAPAAARPRQANAPAAGPWPAPYKPRWSNDALAEPAPPPPPLPVARTPVNLPDRAIRVSDLSPGGLAGVVPLELPWRRTRRTWMRRGYWKPPRQQFFLEMPSLQSGDLESVVREDWREISRFDSLKIGWKKWISGGPKS